MSEPRSTRAAVWRLGLAMGVSTVGRSMLGTAVPLFAVALEVAPLWVGVLVALPNALPVVLGLSAGRWVDGAGAGRGDGPSQHDTLEDYPSHPLRMEATGRLYSRGWGA